MSTLNPTDRNILLAVDNSENSQKAVSYVARLLGGIGGGFHITLLHLIIEPDTDYFPSEQERISWLKQHTTEVGALLEKYRSILEAHGIGSDQIRIHTPVRYCPSVSECILAEKDILEYGTIVVGRKGLTPKEEILLGSVSSKLVKLAKNCAVWVVN
ncbi:universal stress protein [Desulfatirhabdium butyrativorans]|uniref:universal stress protein n=1 Tax=Desulfatirhabdium butyrativorans TaxID=340467 RepID=UPI000428BDAB|nr:universal stress protein [Desulfatirhabdium butyrativorans]